MVIKSLVSDACWVGSSCYLYSKPPFQSYLLLQKLSPNGHSSHHGQRPLFCSGYSMSFPHPSLPVNTKLQAQHQPVLSPTEVSNQHRLQTPIPRQPCTARLHRDHGPHTTHLGWGLTNCTHASIQSQKILRAFFGSLLRKASFLNYSRFSIKEKKP